MKSAAALRERVYQEGQRAARSWAPCPYADWRATTWMKGFNAAREYNSRMAEEAPKAENKWASPSELLPCPFCGSGDIANVSAGHARPTDRWHAGDEIFAVNCRGCGAGVPNSYSNSVVVDAWNRRA